MARFLWNSSRNMLGCYDAGWPCLCLTLAEAANGFFNDCRRPFLVNPMQYIGDSSRSSRIEGRSLHRLRNEELNDVVPTLFRIMIWIKLRQQTAGGEDFVAGVYSLTAGVRSAPWLAVPSGGTGS